MGFLIMGAIGYFIKLSEYIYVYIPTYPAYMCLRIVNTRETKAGTSGNRRTSALVKKGKDYKRDGSARRKSADGLM